MAADCCAATARIEQALGRIDVQIVREIEDVRDQRALDRVRLQADVEIA